MVRYRTTGWFTSGVPTLSRTVQRLESVLRPNLTVFARVDHSGEAEEGRLAMRATQLIIFGSPKGGTPLMVASPTLAIDLPPKGAGLGRRRRQGLLSYNGPDYLKRRHAIPDDSLKNIAVSAQCLKRP